MEDAHPQDDMKAELIQVSSSISSFLETHGDIALSAFRNAFKEKLHLTVIEKEQIHIKGSIGALEKMKMILMSEPVKLYHSSKVKSWLTKNSASWLTFTNYLTVEYLCAIYTETDFSKSYIFVAPHHNKEVSVKIKDFLPFNEIEALPEDKNSEALPEDKNSEKSLPVSVYQPFVDYLKNNEEMASILKRENQSSPDTPLIKIDTSKESLKILKSSLEKVTSQSCLLNASKAKLFTAFRDEILSDIQRNYQVIGKVYQSDSSMNSLVLTPQTDLICIVCSEPDYCPVDNYIGLKCSFSHSHTEYTVAKKFPSGDKIWKGETWNLPFNQRLYAELPLMQIDDMTVHFKSVLEECFQILDDNNSFSSKITGIDLTVTDLKVLNQFCSDLVAALQSFDQMHLSNSSHKCIAVMVDTPEIQVKITETLSELSQGKTEGSNEDKNVLLGAIPKTSKRTQQEILEDKPVLWVQLSDFSGTPENLRRAVDTLIQKLTKEKEDYIITRMAKIHRNKLESLLFFFEEEIIQAVPDIKDQLAKSGEDIITVIIPKNSQINLRHKFKKMLKKIKKKQVDVQSIQEKTLLNSIVSQYNHKFPNVKCNYMEGRSNILIESLNLKDLQMVERKIKSQLGQLPDQENPNSKELPGNIQEDLEDDIELGQTRSVSSHLTFKVLHNDILSVDAEAIACPVFSSMTQISHVCQLILNHAGAEVKEELMACYDQHPDKLLPDGKVITTSAGNLKYKLIIYVSCSEYQNSKYDDHNIQQMLTQAMCNLLNKAESHQLQSVAFPILGTGIFNVPLDLCLDATLDGITSFVNQHSDKHLQVISFVDNHKYNSLMIMNFLTIYKIPFQHNLRRRRQEIKPSMLIPCPVCFKPVTNSKKFDDCQHEYCSECIKEWLEVIGQKCPLCLNMNPQPPGGMRVELSKTSLPGFEIFQTYVITYIIPNGIQQKIHPNPGKMYHGSARKAYLPASEEGEYVLKMLQKAFKEHLIFSVGESLSRKMSDVVIWNGILHKSKQTGGPSVYGYPDPLYLDHVTAQLVGIGITPESVESEEIEAEIKLTAFS